MGENDLTTEYKIIADAAFDTLNKLNAAFEATGRSVKLSKSAFNEFASSLDNTVASLGDVTGKLNQYAEGFKTIVSQKSTVGGALNAIGSYFAQAVSNTKRGTDALVAWQNQVKRFNNDIITQRLEKQRKAQEALTAASEETRLALVAEDKLRVLRGQQPLNPHLRFSDPKEQSAALVGTQSKNAALRAQDSREINSILIQSRIDAEKSASEALGKVHADYLDQQAQTNSAALEKQVNDEIEADKKARAAIKAQLQDYVRAREETNSAALEKITSDEIAKVKEVARLEIKNAADMAAFHKIEDEKRVKQEEEGAKRAAEIENSIRHQKNFDSFDAGAQKTAEEKFDFMLERAKKLALKIKAAQEEIARERKRTADLEDETNAAGLEHRIAEEKKAADERAAFEEGASARLNEIRELQRKTDATIAEFERKEEDKRQEQITKDFKEEVNKRIAAYKAFIDAQRTGLTKGQFATLSPEKLQEFQQGSNLSKGISNGAADTAAINSIREMEADFRRAGIAQDEVIKGARELGVGLRENKDRIKEFTLSWQSLGRIVVARAVSEAFFAIQSSIRESVKAAIDLQNRIAEIQTITDKSSRGAVDFQSSLTSILNLSSKINFAPDDTAAAVYEALSNQLGNTTFEVLGFVEAAGKLSKVTRSTLADSSDAISSVINAYNLSATEATKVSAQLFNLVDQGRIQLREVANTMGDVAVPAAQLGVSFDEVVAGLSAISIAGVPASESMTLYRNIMFQLIKPTKSMTKLFAEWGVETGQAAIATFGFTGVLEKLDIEAEKGNTQIVKLFGTIRAVRGILGLTGQNLDKYVDALEASKVAQEEYNKIVDDYVQNSGEVFNRLINQSTIEVERLGLRFVDLVANFANIIDGSDKGTSHITELVKILIRLGLVLGTTSAAFLVTITAIEAAIGVIGLFTLTTGGATVAVGSLVTALAALNINPIVAAVSASIAVVAGLGAAYIALSDSAVTAYSEIEIAVREANKELGKESFEKLTETFEKLGDAYDRKVRGALKDFADQISGLNKEIRELEKAGSLDSTIDEFKKLSDAVGGDDIKQKLSLYFGDAATSAELFANGIRLTNKEIEKNKTALDNQGKSIASVIDKLQAQKEAIFGVLNANRDSTQQSITERNLSRFQGPELARRQFGVAQDFARQASNTTDNKEANRLFEIAKKFLKEAESNAFQTGMLGNLNNHIDFFNRQESALAAAQERRNVQEAQALENQQRYNAGIYFQKKASYDLLTAEELRRKGIKEDYDLAIAIGEEYQRQTKIIDQNRREGKITPEEARNQQGLLDQKLGVSLTSESSSAIAKMQTLYSSIIEAQNKSLEVAEKEIKVLAISKAKSDIEAARAERTNMQDRATAGFQNTISDFEKTAKGLLADKRERQGLVANAVNDPNGMAALAEREKLDASIAAFIEREQQIRSQVDANPNLLPEILKKFIPELEAFVDKTGNNPILVSGLENLKEELKALELTQADLKTANESLSKRLQEDTYAIIDNATQVQINSEALDEWQGGAAGTSGSGESEQDFLKKKDATLNQEQVNAVRESIRLDDAEALTRAAADNIIAQVQNLDLETSTLKKEAEIADTKTSAVDQEIKAKEEETARFNAIVEQYNAMMQELQQFNPDLAPHNPKINGQPFQRKFGTDNSINGVPFVDDGRNNSINGVPWVDDGKAAASVSRGVEEGAQSIPGAMAEGSNSVSGAMNEGVNRIPQAIVDGMAESFRQQQQAQNEGIHYAQPERRFAMGGPVGTDTIPAWLSPGEFVVRAQAARQNFDILQAINTGSFRRYANGGSVSNSQSFSSTFNMRTENPQMQAAHIVSVLKRQLSQGKATLSKGRPY